MTKRTSNSNSKNKIKEGIESERKTKYKNGMEIALIGTKLQRLNCDVNGKQNICVSVFVCFIETVDYIGAIFCDKSYELVLFFCRFFCSFFLIFWG